jgi:hypothetical protein
MRPIPLVLLFLPEVACGSVVTQTGDAASPSRTTSSASPDPTINWHTYVSPKWGYTIKYPESWLDIPNYGAPDTEKYFSNENAGSPSALDAAGIYFAISVNGSTGDNCLQRGLRNVAVGTQTSLTVDGVTSTLNSLVQQGYGELIVNVQRSNYCYWFAYVFQSTQVRDATEPTVRAMLGQTFRFGTPSASPVPQP